MKKRFIAIITITLMAVLMLGSMGMSVFANDIDYEENGVFEYKYDLKANAESRSTSYFYEKAETTSIELIDPATLGPLDSSVATASFKNNKYGTEVTITFKKEGKVYLTHNFIDHRENDQLACTYGAYEIKNATYSCPVKSLKLGKNNMTKKLGHSRTLTGKAFKGKVTFKAKKGWKFKKMYKYNTNALMEGKTEKMIPLKKNKAVTLKKGELLVIQFEKGGKISSISYKAK